MEDSLKWKTLKRATIVKDNWINLEACECQLPNGMVVSPFYVSHPKDFVAVVAVTRGGELVVERQYRQGTGEVLLEIPAGVIENGESGEQAARRELLEETGYLAPDMELLFRIAPNASNASNHAWCYLARNVVPQGEQKLDTSEFLEVMTIPLDRARELLQKGEFQQAVHVAALYRALEIMDQADL